MRAGFTPAIGSSSMIRRGSAISARAISSSLRWPPERLPANSSRMWASRKRSSSPSALASISFSCALHSGLSSPRKTPSPRWSVAPSFMFSMTDRRVRALVSWNVRTMPRRAVL